MSRLLKADYFIEAVEHIDLESWWSEGVRGLILDVDDTLTRKNSPYLSTAVQSWLLQAKARGFICYLVSNNASLEHIERIAQRLDIPAIARARKPRRSGFMWAIQDSGLPPHQLVAIGDRVLTDILGGRRLGLKTCLVKPVTKRLTRRKRLLYAFEERLSQWLPL
jgi:uncharacterized protein